MHTIETCVETISFAADAENNGGTPQRRMAALSVCLSRHSLLSKFDTTRRKLLLEFHRNTSHPSNSIALEAKKDDSDSHPMEIVDLHVYGEDSSWFSRQRMVGNALKEFNPQCSDIGDVSKILYQLLDKYRKSTRVDDGLFLELASCLQKWCMFVDGEGKESSFQNFITMLKEWAIEASVLLENPNSKALLATILLSSNNKITSDEGTNTIEAEFEEWYTPLSDILRRESIDDENTTSKNSDVLLQATMENLRSHQVQGLLSNLLDLTTSSQLLLLINHVLRQPQNASLKLAVSLLARGDSIAKIQQLQDDESPKDGIDKDDWDDGDDSDEDEEGFDQKPSSHKKARGGSMHYKRQEILTMIKLDRYYSERIQQAHENYRQAFDTLTMKVANKIIKAPWKDWGLCILRDQKSEGPIDNQIEVDCYVETLGSLLQASSNMRSMSKFTPLSPLAFNPTILGALWNRIRKGQRGLLLSIFSDLFSHYLLALSDDDFVKYHCSNESSTNFDNRINAKDIVVCYGQALHELYWTKPVVCSEIQMDDIRGRLLLSGTKLWNSLYERWNRLVNISFCEESTWWFPYMGSREGDRAVVPDREIGQAEDDYDSDSMNVDEDQNPLSKAEEASDALADSFRDPKMARVLTSIPQALPFDRRVKLFHSLVKADKQKVVQAHSNRRAMMAIGGQRDDEGEMMMWLDGSVREQIKIKRASLYKDSMETLDKLGAKLKHKSKSTAREPFCVKPKDRAQLPFI